MATKPKKKKKAAKRESANVGKPEAFRLLYKAGANSTRALDVPGGVLVQVTVPEGVALAFVPAVKVGDDPENPGGGTLISQQIRR